MKWIKILCKPFIWIYNNVDPIETDHITANGKNNETTINPATGLPMSGAFDSQGNTRGTSALNSHHDWHNDYSRSYSSYDPFSNRY